MKNFYSEVKAFYPSVFHFNIAMLLFRAAVATEMIRVHGLKKIGIGVAEIENVPNPYHLPEFINHASAIASDFFFPLMVIAGLLTRLAVLPSLVVTLTGFL
jgi:putative oxidoreductase